MEVLRNYSDPREYIENIIPTFSEEKEKLLLYLNILSKGLIHNDLHFGNVVINDEDKKMYAIDWAPIIDSQVNRGAFVNLQSNLQNFKDNIILSLDRYKYFIKFYKEYFINKLEDFTSKIKQYEIAKFNNLDFFNEIIEEISRIEYQN